MANLETQIAKAAMVEQLAQNRAKALAAERNTAPAATDQHREMRTSDLFREQFGHGRQAPAADPGPRRWETPQDRPWDSLMRLAADMRHAADDDAPHPPELSVLPPVPPAPEPPPEETRVRQLGSADELFAAMEQRLSHTPEAANLPADVQIRRAYRDLPGSQREAIAALVEREDFQLPGYFASRNMQGDYVAALVGSALARRFADAQRLQPELTPAELLQQITAAAEA